MSGRIVLFDVVFDTKMMQVALSWVSLKAVVKA